MELSGKAAGREISAGLLPNVLMDLSAMSWHHEARSWSFASLTLLGTIRDGVRLCGASGPIFYLIRHGHLHKSELTALSEQKPPTPLNGRPALSAHDKKGKGHVIFPGVF